jgi:hypothetical protein
MDGRLFLFLKLYLKNHSSYRHAKEQQQPFFKITVVL